jgi:DNA-binding response OmpR family regulator
MTRDEIILVRAFGLTAMQARLLLALFNGGVFNRYTLLDAVGSSKCKRRVVDVHICHLRRKFGRDSIKTIHSYGYELADDLRETLAMLVQREMAA